MPTSAHLYLIETCRYLISRAFSLQMLGKSLLHNYRCRFKLLRLISVCWWPLMSCQYCGDGTLKFEEAFAYLHEWAIKVHTLLHRGVACYVKGTALYALRCLPHLSSYPLVCLRCAVCQHSRLFCQAHSKKHICLRCVHNPP